MIFLIVPLLVGLLLPYFLLRTAIQSGIMPKWFRNTFFQHKISFFQVQVLENVESPVNSMSIGLLFGVSLLHLIPDANEDMENALERAEADTNYPVAMLLVAVGFFIVTLVEIVVSNCSSKVSTRDADGPSLF